GRARGRAHSGIALAYARAFAFAGKDACVPVFSPLLTRGLLHSQARMPAFQFFRPNFVRASAMAAFALAVNGTSVRCKNPEPRTHTRITQKNSLT
ncbi:MAG: hypothetical protein ACRD6X_13045, partial [Pyrinomonadaceae bacterium]